MNARRTAAGLALFVTLSLAGAWLVFDRAIRRSADQPIAAAALALRKSQRPASAELAVVESVRGSVQRSTGEKWAPLSAGDRIGANESVRTGRGGGTALRIGSKSRLAVSPSSQLLIRELSESLHRFKLMHGRVQVEYDPDNKRVLRIEGGDGDTAAVTQGARFSVLSTGRSIAIATERGSVDLEAQGAKVRVDPGRQSTATAGRVPTQPKPIPTSLWLKVANAIVHAPEEVCGFLQGTAPAGSEVTIDGHPVELAADGSFSVQVPRAGRTAVIVSIRDAAGRTLSREIGCAEEQGAAHDVALQWRKGSR